MPPVLSALRVPRASESNRGRKDRMEALTLQGILLPTPSWQARTQVPSRRFLRPAWSREGVALGY